MKNLFLAALLIISITSCSSEPNSPTEEKPTKFEVALSPSSLNLQVDESAVVGINSQSPLNEIKWVWDGGNKSHSAYYGESLAEDIELYFGFPFPGNYPVALEFTGVDGQVVKKQLNFKVVPGNTVQITAIEVKSFYKMGEAWDPEAPEAERLADLIFALEKPQQTGFTEERYSKKTWFISDIHQNESSLSWNLSEKQLFLNPMMGFHFGMGDIDEGNMHENLLLNQLSYFIELKNEISNRPETIELIDEEVDLHVTFHLTWP